VTLDVIETAVIIFADTRAVTLVMGHRRTDPRGYDDTQHGFATHPVSRRTVALHRIGQGLWKQANA
jgi:hypothetical protein